MDTDICVQQMRSVVSQVSKEFMMSPNKLHLECSLDKELYYHGETISVNVHIQVRSHITTYCVGSKIGPLTVLGKHQCSHTESLLHRWKIKEVHALTCFGMELKLDPNSN